MTRRFLFVGPSLPDAGRLVGDHDVTVVPPIAAGDLLALGLARDDRVGIVDGYFHQARAIPHKEIMAVLAAGVDVLGAASMGALRAAELGPWGMRGIGGIYAAYRDGELVGDDEVTLLHGPAEEGYRHLSAPLVNLRATLGAAARAGQCSARTADRLVEALRTVPYRDRSCRRLPDHAEAVGLDRASAVRLMEYCLANQVDRKRSDAEQLLAELTAEAARSPTPRSAPHRTIYLRTWQLEAVGDDLNALRTAQVLAADYPDLHRDTALAAIREECCRRCGDADPDPVRHATHRGWFALDEPEPDLSFLTPWTGPAERNDTATTELLTRFLVRSYRIAPGVGDTERALAAFRAHPGYDRGVRLAARVAAMNRFGREHRSDFDPSYLAADVVYEWLGAHWGCPVGELELAAFDRGFVSLAELLDAARPAYLAGRADPQARGFRLSPPPPG
jgi:hypothetical protein